MKLVISNGSFGTKPSQINKVFQITTECLKSPSFVQALKAHAGYQANILHEQTGNDRYCNVTFTCSDGLVYAHHAVLKLKGFKGSLSQREQINVDTPVSKKVMKMFIDCLYKGIPLNRNQLDESEQKDLLEVAAVFNEDAVCYEELTEEELFVIMF